MEDSATLSLPDDPAALKAIIAKLQRQRDEAQVKALRFEVELLRLRKLYYGAKADKLTHYSDTAQLVLEFGQQIEALPPLSPAQVQDVDAIADDGKPGGGVDLREVDLPSVRKVGGGKGGRRNLSDKEFENLPVIRKEHDLPEAEKPCPCCGELRDRIGSESSWQLEYVPGHFERIEHVRHRYACRKCEGDAQSPQITLADKPSAPIDKGLPGPGLLSFVVTSKFADYVPLYRLEDLFARSGVEISRATMSVWCGDVAALLKPVYDLMVRRVLQSHVVCTDDTPMPMLSPGNGKTKTARMWVYVGDEHNPYDVFDFTLSRGRDGPAGFLKDYRNILVADAYGGYDGVVVGNQMTRTGCWAHARRKFVDAEKSHPAIAREVVSLIGELYKTEREAQSAAPVARLSLRQQKSRPVLDALHHKLSDWKLALLPKHPMSEAMGYVLRQWQELNVFLNEGGVPIDNNISEREMKRIVLGRKNHLFVGNERGGKTAAILASLTSTCRRHDIDVQHYLTQLLTNLPGTPMSQLDRWLPDRWKAARTTVSPGV
jgi:transposase